jgi:hypothetical protein
MAPLCNLYCTDNPVVISRAPSKLKEALPADRVTQEADVTVSARSEAG